MRFLNLGATIFAVVLAGCAAPQPGSSPQAVDPLSLDKQHFYSTASVEDDALTTAATLDTSKGYTPARGLLSENQTDAFVRSVVDKKSGRTGFMLYQLITYRDFHWHFYNGATYLGADGPVNAKFRNIHRDVSCRGGRGTGCFYMEHVAYDIPLEVMRDVAARYDAGDRGAWAYKFSSRRAGQDYQGSIPYAELAGLWERVRDYRQQLGLPPL